MKNQICCAVLLAVLSAPTLASNFSYSHIGVDFGQVSLDDDFIFFGEAYDDFGFFSLGGGYQFSENVAVSLTSSAFVAEEGNTELTFTFVELYLHFPVSVSEHVDIVPFFGLRNDELEGCLGNICVTTDESNGGYGLAIRAWVSPETLELNVSYTDSNADDFSAEIELGVSAYINKNNSVQFNYLTEDFLSRFTVGYRYYW